METFALNVICQSQKRYFLKQTKKCFRKKFTLHTWNIRTCTFLQHIPTLKKTTKVKVISDWSNTHYLFVWAYLSIRTRAGMPPDLKMESRPSLWWDRLWRMEAVAFAVSMSLVFCIARTTAATICGDCIIARRDASLRVSWLTIWAAFPTTTWTEGKSSFLLRMENYPGN